MEVADSAASTLKSSDGADRTGKLAQQQESSEKSSKTLD